MNNLKETMDNFIKTKGINPDKITLENKLLIILHQLPALIKDGHMISIGPPGIGKTTLIKESCSNENIAELTNTSLAYLFGDMKSKEQGLLTKGKSIVFLEQGTEINISDPQVMSPILTHTNGDNVERIENADNSERTSLVILGNPDDKYYLKDYSNCTEFPQKFDLEYFNSLPSSLLTEQIKQRFIILPSFLMEEISNNILILETSGNSTTNDNRKGSKNYSVEECDMRAYKKICKIIDCLNYFLGDDKELEESSDMFKGLYAIAKSIIEIGNGVYKPFYFENKEGRKLALNLLYDDTSQIEEAHFLENRAIVKFKNENYLRKIALNIYGKIENQREYKWCKKNKKSFIADVFEASNDFQEVKQEYFKLSTDSLSINLKSVEDSFKETFFIFMEENRQYVNRMALNMEYIKQGRFTDIISIPLYKKDPMIEEVLNYHYLIEELKDNNFIFDGDIPKRDFGISNNGYKLINFTKYIDI